MHKITSLIFLTTLCLFGKPVQAQQTKRADNIYHLMQSSGDSVQKLRLVLDYCGEYRSYPYDTFHKYAVYAIALADSLNDSQSRNEAILYLATYYYKMSRLDSARQYINRITANTDGTSLPDAFRNKLDILNTRITVKENNLGAALQELFTIMARAERQKDSVGYLNAISCIGWVYLEIGNEKEAKAWSLKGINMQLSEGLMKYAANFYNNIIPCYGKEGRLDSVKYYINKALLLADKYGNLLLKANVLSFRANLYKENRKYPEAIATLMQAITIRKYINDPFFVVSDMATLSEIYDEAGLTDKGIETAKEGLRIAKEKNIDIKLPLLYLALFYNYANKGDYKMATEILLKLSALKDSLYQKTSAKNIAEMEVKYQTAEKEKIIQRQQFALARKNYWLYGSLILLVLTLLLVIIGYRSYRNKQKLSIQKLQLKQQVVLAQSIVQAEENERKRIAADLHDGLGQMLTAAKYNLSGIADDMQNWDDDKKTIFNKASALIDDSCKEVRIISHNIMPNDLLSNGFTATVKNFLEKARSEKLAVHFNASGIDKYVGAETQVMLYRIIQECVQNVIKHAAASKLDISVMNDESGISVSMEDDGKGFSRHDTNNANGLGLKNILTRTEYLRGRLEIDTQPGKGTLISIHIPPEAV